MNMTMTTDQLTPPAGTYQLDPTHTTLTIVARHLMVSKVRAVFGTFEGTIEVADDAAASSVKVTVDASSIDSQVEDRDNHLRSPDFLDVENFPTITFTSTSVTSNSTGWELAGDLTIRDTTNRSRSQWST